MVERPDEIDRLDDEALAGRLDFDDWIRELALIDGSGWGRSVFAPMRYR